ncbi:MAG: ATP-binding protein [Bacteroidota bacterium]
MTSALAMLKNATPRQIALMAATLIAAISTAVIGIGLLFISQDLANRMLVLLGCAIATFFIAYLIILSYLRRYIYRKIKLIYKTIHNRKVSTDIKSTTVDLDADIIREVEEDVADWAKSQEEQLEKFRGFAEYRRRYIGDISHELKTPIFNIQGYLHTLINGGLNDQTIARPFLEKAAKNVERLQTIVDDLSAINRLETGDQFLDVEVFDLRALAKEVIEDLEMKANQSRVQLQLKDGANQPFMVEADRENIRQVFTNLINNSIKYGNEGGITKIALYDMADTVLVEVADDGIGIGEKHLPHVFDRFYRVDKSRSRQKGGSGLGLSIVKHIIEAHQQTINVRSTKGLGSTFGFTLAKASK